MAGKIKIAIFLEYEPDFSDYGDVKTVREAMEIDKASMLENAIEIMYTLGEHVTQVVWSCEEADEPE